MRVITPIHKAWDLMEFLYHHLYKNGWPASSDESMKGWLFVFGILLRRWNSSSTVNSWIYLIEASAELFHSWMHHTVNESRNLLGVLLIFFIHHSLALSYIFQGWISETLLATLDHLGLFFTGMYTPAAASRTCPVDTWISPPFHLMTVSTVFSPLQLFHLRFPSQLCTVLKWRWCCLERPCLG